MQIPWGFGPPSTVAIGPLAFALRALPAKERVSVEGEITDSLGRFEADGGYELPGVALGTVAS